MLADLLKLNRRNFGIIVGVALTLLAIGTSLASSIWHQYNKTFLLFRSLIKIDLFMTLDP